MELLSEYGEHSYCPLNCVRWINQLHVGIAALDEIILLATVYMAGTLFPFMEKLVYQV